jgi:hypothetical protein
MTPNRQSTAYALFARRPIVPQPLDVLAADPPASQEPLRRPVPKTLPSPSARFPRARGSKSEGNISTAQGGCGPQILSAFMKQRTYQPLPMG